MIKLSGKYFAETVAKIKESKNSENIRVPKNFREELRAALVERASGQVPEASEAFGLADFVRRWKYVIGAVPTFAAVALVAANFSALQVMFTGPEVIPVVQDTAKELEISDDVEMLSVDEIEPDRIDTFSAASVLPPEEILNDYFNSIKQPVAERPRFIEMPAFDVEPASVPSVEIDVEVPDFDLYQLDESIFWTYLDGGEKVVTVIKPDRPKSEKEEDRLTYEYLGPSEEAASDEVEFAEVFEQPSFDEEAYLKSIEEKINAAQVEEEPPMATKEIEVKEPVCDARLDESRIEYDGPDHDATVKEVMIAFADRDGILCPDYRIVAWIEDAKIKMTLYYGDKKIVLKEIQLEEAQNETRVYEVPSGQM